MGGALLVRSLRLMLLAMVVLADSAGATLVIFDGFVSVTSNFAGTVTIRADEVANIDPFYISGTLNLEYWAFPAPFNGSTQFGYRIATAQLGQLLPGYSFFNVNRTVAATAPPYGFYYPAVLLTEYPFLALDTRDWANFGGQFMGVPSDSDLDGWNDLLDNCPLIWNPSQSNVDGDSWGDACDSCPVDPANDVDSDGRCANADNCPATYNPNQQDSDGDGLGDACDATPVPCGNGVVQPGEQCDLGAQNGQTGSCCTLGCTLVGSGAQCRASAGPCDRPEVCTGSSAACPPDQLTAAGVECRPSLGDCDIADFCTGSSPSCGDRLKGLETACRPSLGGCDPPEACDGTAASCPADKRFGPETACRARDGDCDLLDFCDGASPTCADLVVVGGTVCRPDQGACDVAEACDGATKACPADQLAAAGVECRASMGDCDVADFCTGSSPDCGDQLRGPETACRPSLGGCDPPEACDGVAPSCPTDKRFGPETACRAPDGDCDVLDFCDGTSPVCADLVEVAGTVCRPDQGACDVAEACDGATKACPTDAPVEIAIAFDGVGAPASLAEATPLTDQFASEGVVWDGSGAIVSEAMIPNLQGYSSPNFAAYAEGEPLLGGTLSSTADSMQIACPADEVSLLVGTDGEAIFVAEAFDSLGEPLADAESLATSAMQPVTLRAPRGESIARLDYQLVPAAEGVPLPRLAIDSILIPEPDGRSLAMLAIVTLLLLSPLSARARRPFY